MKSDTKRNLGLLLIRLIIGLVFIIHGLLKLQNLESTGLYFTQLHIPFPAVMAYVVGIIEVAGGLLVALGFLMTTVNLIFMVIMAVAILTVGWSKGFVDGYEFMLTLLFISLALICTGPGEWKVNRLFRKRWF